MSYIRFRSWKLEQLADGNDVQNDDERTAAKQKL